MESVNDLCVLKLENAILRYIDGMDSVELAILELAKTQLESSFDIEKSIGFLEFLSKNNVILSIKNGFEKALSTILDANITTLIAALLLFVFGSGPIKGFSITLSIGIITSMFSAIMLTNFLVYFWFSISKKQEINL